MDSPVTEIINIAGVAITLLGFIVTLRQIRKTRNAAIAAKEASDGTKMVLERNNMLVDVSSCIRLIDAAKGYIRTGKYELALLRATDISAQLNQLRNMNQFRNRTDQHRITEMLSQFRILITGLEEAIVDSKLDYNKMQAISKLIEISATLNDLLGHFRYDVNTGGQDDSRHL